jgi:uncharacterized membrane protein YiaA
MKETRDKRQINYKTRYSNTKKILLIIGIKLLVIVCPPATLCVVLRAGILLLGYLLYIFRLII